jgi:hypothetical protein
MPNIRPIRPAPAPKPLEERGRILYADDIVQLYRGKRKRSWVLRHFAPDQRQKDGKLVYWWECDVLKYLDEAAA